MRESKTTTILNQLKKDINEGVYSPNEKLIENDLANRFETSRNTIRNVLSLLEKDNLVSIVPHKGAKVIALNTKDIINLLEVRAELEGYVFQKVTPLLSDDEIKKMSEIYKQMVENIEENNLQNHSGLNQSFHEVVYSKCDNTVAIGIIRDLKNQLSKYNFKTILIPGRKEATLIEHKNLLEAVKSRDGALASQRAKEHIFSVRDTLLDYNDYLNH